MSELEWIIESPSSYSFWQEYVSGEVRNVMYITPDKIGCDWDYYGTLVVTDTGFYIDNPHEQIATCTKLEGVDSIDDAKAAALMIWRMS